ncbi:MAG: PMT 2 protein [Anaerolineales bacterium]|nr:PMT 2 protein [Anaerolineales bacterium]
MSDLRPSPPRRRLAFPLGIVFALAVILSAYYLIHKPVQGEQAVGLFSTLADVAVVGAFTLLGGGVGRRILRTWLIASPGERITLQLALGWGLIGMAMLALGLARLYYAIVLWPLALIALLLLWREARGWLGDCLHAFRALWFPDRLSRLAGLFVLFTLGLGLLTALAPPVKWDALVYHLTLPKLYGQTHGVRLEADFFFSGMPQLTEMLYTAAVLLRGPIAAQTLGWAFGALLALGLAAHAHELLGARFAALTPAVLFSSFTVALSLSWAYADMLLMLLSLAGLIALRQWRITQQARWLWLAAIFTGFAMGCKYTAALVPLAGAAIILFTLIERRSGSAQTNHRVTLSPRHLVYFLIISSLIFSPWLLKNWFFTSSPTYPLLFPASHVDALRLQFYNQPDLADRNLLWAALIFFRNTFLGVQGGDPYDATLGPLFVLLLFGLALGWRSLASQVRDTLRPLAVFALVSYLGWVSLTFMSYYAVQARLFFAIFPALALLCAGGLAALTACDTPTLRVSLIVKAVLIFVLVLSALEQGIAFAAHSPLAYLAGAQRAADYRAANLGWYAVTMERVNALPAGARVVFLWEPRSLECAASDRCDPDVIIDRWWHLRRKGMPPAAAIADWKAQGATHVLIYDAGVKFLRDHRDIRFAESDWTELENLREQMRRVEQIGSDYSLYTLP